MRRFLAPPQLDSPWWRRRERPRYPAAWRLRPGVPRGRPGVAACSLRWWRRWPRRHSAAAAARYRPSLTDWRCAAPSGRPAQDTELNVSDELQSQSAPLASGTHWQTLDLVSTLAPFFSRYRTTSAWPALAAMWRAVSPRWNTGKGIKTQRKWERKNKTIWCDWYRHYSPLISYYVLLFCFTY